MNAFWKRKDILIKADEMNDEIEEKRSADRSEKIEEILHSYVTVLFKDRVLIEV